MKNKSIRNSVLVISCYVINYPNAQWLKTTIVFVCLQLDKFFRIHGDKLFLLHVVLTGVAHSQNEFTHMAGKFVLVDG